MRRTIATIAITAYAIATLSISAAALTAYDRQELSHVNSLADQNPGFESGTVKWSGSPALTINSNAASQFVPGSKQFASWDSNSASQEVCSALVKVPESGNCAVSLTYKVPSGTATHKIVAKDGSKDLSVEDVVSSTAAWRHDVEFPCAAAASNQARVCLRSVASNEPAIQLDGGYAGEARNVGVADLITEWRTDSTTGSWTANATYIARWRRVGDTMELQGSVATSAAPTPAGSLTFNIPSAANCTIDQSKLANQTTYSLNVLGSGATRDDSTGGLRQDVTVYYNSTSSLFFQTLPLASGSSHAGTTLSNTSPMTWDNLDSLTFEARFPCVGWAASQTIMPDAQGWYAAGNISGANSSLGVGNVSTFTEITSASLTLTPKSGSAPVGIMCSGTNAAATPSTSSTTCSAGNESIGFNVSVPRSGAYEMCFHFSHNMASNSNGAGLTTFQVIRTSINSQTISEEGGGKTHSGNSGGSTSGASNVAFMSRSACGNFNLSAGINGFRLMYEQSVGPTPPVASDVVADADASAGQRDIYFLMKPISQQQRAILANSVTTKRQSGDRILSGTFNCDASSTVTRTNEPDSTSIGNIASGACAVTYAPFSAAPDACTPVIQTCSASSGTGCFARASTAATASGVSVQCYSDTGTLCTSHDFYMICTGPR